MYPTEVMAAVVLQWWTLVVEAVAVEKANRCCQLQRLCH